ncbi:protein-glutamate O-methyltransferase CheR [Labilibaculum sp. K2S]|uniref:CheR family methyltransferase n=1 Tax=Labilibaculum sp. K2S TaxID=3056386 RepID=UPI0025A3495B|nr:protein-glutamate O-methyltransferase CheR [Labilibaculum sp. K2S]MDM8159539.1 protein-glutamate O-methyltransferase CheR [Labilibaculum sp. K2S]
MPTSSSKDITNKGIHEILNLLFLSKKLNLNGSNLDFLHRRISRRMGITQTENHQEYLEYLQNNPNEIDNLQDVLTINVSHFFRNSFTFEYLNKIIIPKIINAKLKTPKPVFRIWSAGCSTGEEAYSTGILIDEYLRKTGLKMDVNIFATDIHQKSLENAKKGEYTTESLKETKLEIITNYFSYDKGKYTILPQIKKMVHFSTFDLLNNQQYAPEESIYGDFDLIFCRNVLIYFNKEYQEIIFNKLYKSLNTSGFLILGEVEEPTGIYKKKFHKESMLFKIYQKS